MPPSTDSPAPEGTDPSARYLGFDVGGTKCAAILGTAAGKVLARRQWPSLTQRGPVAMIADFLAAAAELRAIAEAGESPIQALGVSIGGPLDARRGIVLSPPHLPGWDAWPLREQLEAALGLPVFVEHDAAACALAEYTWGGLRAAGAGAAGGGDDSAAEACRSLLYLTCGTGFGAGLVVDGAIYRGAGGHSMEIGHARYAADGPTAFGKAGSVEGWCSGVGLGLLSGWLHGRERSGEAVAAAAAAGEAEALAVVRAHAEATGQVCANLADLLFPDLILLGSLARHLGEPWLATVRERFLAEAHPHARERCRLLPAALGDRLQDLSALVAATQGGGRRR